MQRFDSGSVAFTFDPEGGHLDDMVFGSGGGAVRPMHTAYWRQNGETDLGGVSPVERNLAGDFFCAPFCANDVIPGPIHGPAANLTWHTVESDPATGIVAELDAPIMGAKVTKRLTLRPGQPVLYQEHVFEGGSGELPLGHHAMLRLPTPGLLAFAPLAFIGTAPEGPEPDPARGLQLLAYPQETDSLKRVLLADGTTADLSSYPALKAHEDLMFMATAPGTALAWTAVTAPREGWLWFALKDPRILPSTMLWMSNGGRYYKPWSGRHTNCLGVEELASNFHFGHAASIRPNALRRRGIATSVELGGTLVVRYAFGAVPVDAQFGRVRDILVEDGMARITGDAGRRLDVPFDDGFFHGH